MFILVKVTGELREYIGPFHSEEVAWDWIVEKWGDDFYPMDDDDTVARYEDFYVETVMLVAPNKFNN